jgi:hypothetical protein
MSIPLSDIENKSRFRVTLVKMDIAPAVGADGELAKAVSFGIQGVGTSFYKVFDGGRVGGETLRRCLLLKALTHLVVEIEPEAGYPLAWQKKVVNAALQGLANIAEE